MRCLLVEDESLVREALALMIERHDGITTVQGAANGAEAIAALEREPFDLVFLDIALRSPPSGLELLDTIKSKTVSYTHLTLPTTPYV